MAVGLPGQQNRTSGSASMMASIQPPLAIPPQSPSHLHAKSKPMHSVAGPQERRTQGGGKGRGRNKAKRKGKGDPDSKTSSDESGRQSSDSESSSGASESSLLQWSTQLHHHQHGSKQKGRSWHQQGRRGVASSSESEVSDSDVTGSTKLKSVWSKIRHQALSCLALLFQVRSRLFSRTRADMSVDFTGARSPHSIFLLAVLPP